MDRYKTISSFVIVSLVMILIGGYVYSCIAAVNNWTIPDWVQSDWKTLLPVIVAFVAPSPLLAGTSSVKTEQLVTAAVTTTPSVDLETDPAEGHP